MDAPREPLWLPECRFARHGPAAGPGRRRVGLAALVSLSLHAAAVLAVAGLVRGGTPTAARADKPAEVELVMIEQRGAGETTVGAEQPRTEDVTPTAMPEPPRPPDETAAEPLPTPREAATTPVEPPEPPKPAALPPAEPVRAPVPVEKAKDANAQAPLSVNLGGTDSESNAIASGDDIIPAKPDNRSRNRPPVYPVEAAQRGQHGNVVLLIHVSREGGTAGVDVMKSSGYAVLDEAARDAVSVWRFVPAIKDGMPVPFDMAMDFRFELTR